MVLTNYLSLERQQELLQCCRQGLRQLRQKGSDLSHHKAYGGQMSVAIASLGQWWTLQGYQPPRMDIPQPIYDLAQEVIKPLPFQPLGAREKCCALLAYYDPYERPGVKMGVHQDKDEDKALLVEDGPPIVSFSLGCRAQFLWGGRKRDDPKQKIELSSGDVAVFGGKARLNYHGIARVYPHTEPLNLETKGRLNITVRQAIA